MRNSIIVILIALVMFSCGTEKKLAEIEANKPVWVKSKPLNSSYYIGVGSSIKTANISEYQQNAKQNALTDMASEISVNISNTSVLRKLEADFNYGETYSSQTKTATAEELEGYEIVETYEDEYNYYVYYHLSKTLYAKLKQEKIQRAIDNAISKYNKADEYLLEKNFKDAITFLIRAMEDIKPYMGESLETQLNGKSVYFGNELISKIQQTLNKISIVSLNKTVSVKRGADISKDQLTFTIKDIDGSVISQLPTIAEFSAQTINDDVFTSDDQGQVKYYLQKVKTKSSTGIFTVKLDIDNILKYASSDLSIRKIIRSFTVPKTEVNIKIEAPGFYVSSIEQNINNNLSVSYIKESFISQLTTEKYRIVNNQQDADFSIFIEANTQNGSQTNNMYSSLLRINVQVKDVNSKLLFQSSVNDIKGTDLSFELAGLKAYKQGVKDSYRKIYLFMISELFN